LTYISIFINSDRFSGGFNFVRLHYCCFCEGIVIIFNLNRFRTVINFVTWNAVLLKYSDYNRPGNAEIIIIDSKFDFFDIVIFCPIIIRQALCRLFLKTCLVSLFYFC